VVSFGERQKIFDKKIFKFDLKNIGQIHYWMKNDKFNGSKQTTAELWKGEIRMIRLGICPSANPYAKIIFFQCL
jgi:hypothetical protein